MVGAIDGSHIPISAPCEAAQRSYYNYKGFFSVVLLAIVDNEGLFSQVDLRWSARVVRRRGDIQVDALVQETDSRPVQVSFK